MIILLRYNGKTREEKSFSMKKEDKMVKLTGIVMIIVSSGFLGNYIYKTLRNRCTMLKDILTSIDILQAEIVFKRSGLHTAVNTVKARTGSDVSGFWEEVIRALNNNEGVEKGFDKGLAILKNRGLSKEDVDAIKLLGGVLGKYDSFEQARLMKNIKELITVQYKDAVKELADKGKLYRAMGISIGIVVALVIV